MLTWTKVLFRAGILFLIFASVIFSAIFPWLVPKVWTPFQDEYQSGYSAGTVYDDSRYITIWNAKFDFRHPWMSFEQWAYCIGFEDGAESIKDTW